MSTVTQDLRPLGESNIQVSAIGIGVWSWGDPNFWGYGKDYSEADVHAAYRASLEAGVNFFDTAEIYGNGASELLLGKFIMAEKQPVITATKFFPAKLRFNKEQFHQALEESLARLGMTEVELYQIHFPLGILSIDTLMDAMSEAVKRGKIKAVGVSNYNARQMKKAAERLGRYGIKLASNQVQYNLLHRTPESNGVLQACKQMKVSLIAYSPLAQGALTSRYLKDPTVKGARRFLGNFRSSTRTEMAPMYELLAKLAVKYSKSVEQVSLNWLLCKDDLLIAIPGAKTAKQATSNAGAMGWRLDAADVAALDKVTHSRLKTNFLPF